MRLRLAIVTAALASVVCVLSGAAAGAALPTSVPVGSAAPDDRWVCDAYDQSSERGRVPEPDGAGRTFPILTVHGITGSDEDFGGIIDQSYNDSFPQPPRSLLDALAGVAGQELPPGLPHAHVYSFSYTPDSLRWIDHPGVGGRLAATIDCLHDRHGMPVSVVAHSMGGLATRWVANGGGDGLARADKVGKVITLGTPYLGSDVAAVAGGIGGLVGAFSPPVLLLNYLCGEAGTATGTGSCAGIPLLSSLNSEAGVALQTGSPELAGLATWSGVDVSALAGSTVLHGTLFGASLASIDVGDMVVGTDSATADSTETKIVTCRYDAEAGGRWDEIREFWNGGESPEERKANLSNFLREQPCYHGKLMRNVELTNEVLGELDDWIGANAVEPSTPSDSFRGFFDGDLPLRWSAETVDQPSSSKTYGLQVRFVPPADLSIGSPFATVSFPGLECSGTWRLDGGDAASLRGTETIDSDPLNTCVTTGSITLDRVGADLIRWNYVDGSIRATADLRPGAAIEPAVVFAGLPRAWADPTVDQPGAAAYGITVTFESAAISPGDVMAVVAYPELSCSGTWTLLTASSSEVSAREQITDDPGGRCVATGTVVLRPSGDAIAYDWVSGSATALLEPV